MLYLWISLEWESSSPLGLSTQVKDILTDPPKHLFSFFFIILWFQAHLCHDFLKEIDCTLLILTQFPLYSSIIMYWSKWFRGLFLSGWLFCPVSNHLFLLKKIPRPSEFEIVFFWEVGQCTYCISDISLLSYKFIWLIKNFLD